MIAKWTTGLMCCLVLLCTIRFAGCAPKTGLEVQNSTRSSNKLHGERKSNDTALGKSENAQIEELIDQLVNVGTEGVGFHSTAWASGFLALDEDPKFRGGVFGSEKPVASEPLRELVRRGVAALPSLIEHLSDERETNVNVAVGQGIIMAQWHSDEYHPRFREPRLQPSNVNTGYELALDSYRLRVGDLCYVAIGQIVNRSLNGVRYQPSGCRVINSPIQRPQIATAVRADWFDLTEEHHRNSLIQDSFVKAPFFAAAAVKRLHFYYPEKGEEIAVRLLSRPPANTSLVGDFIHRKLLAEPDSSKWKDLLDEFKSQSSSADADSIPLYIAWMSQIAAQHGEGSDFAEDFAMARKLLEREYPDYDLHNPSFINSVWISDQSSFIDGISAIKSDAIDDAVFDFFDAAVQSEFAWERPIQLDDLARYCMDRLIGKGHDAVFLEYCNKRIATIEQTPSDSTQRYRLDSLKDWALRLQNP